MDGVTAGYYTLNQKINKVKPEDSINVEGVSQVELPEIDPLKLKLEELVERSNTWENAWKSSDTYQKWLQQGVESSKYWKGEHHGKADMEMNRPVIDNAIFEALETWLPVATKRNPEPLITFIHGDDEQKFPNVKLYFRERLNYLANHLKIRLKIQKMTRTWALKLLGVIYIGWDLAENEMSIQSLRPESLILDPDSYTDEDGYHGEFIGRYRKIPAAKLIDMSPQHKEYISEQVHDQLNTRLTIIEYYTNEFLWWKYQDKVFLKVKNPNWNYEQTVTSISVDEFGNEIPQESTKAGINFFKSPKMPFVFLSIYNLGDKPVDDTSLILQNLSNQDMINKRNKQIDRNVDDMNNGLIVSLANSGLTKEQAKNVTTALRKGGVVMVPSGSPGDAIQKMRGDQLSPDVFTDLQYRQNRLRNIFGTQGISSAGIQQEESVRGKLVVKGLDTDRIGGLIADYLDNAAGQVFEWMAQMMLVYYDNDPFIASLQQIPDMEIRSKEGSMLPDDTAAEASQAMQLAQMGLISPIDLYTKLEYPDPVKMAADLFLWQNAPTQLLADDPRIQAFQQQQQQAQEQQMQMQQEQTQAEQQDKVMDRETELRKEQMSVTDAEEERKLKLLQILKPVDKKVGSTKR